MSRSLAHPRIELAELRLRVRTAVERLGELADEDDRRNERLSSLLGVIEDHFAYSQDRIENLTTYLAHTEAENRQLQAMLRTFIVRAESVFVCRDSLTGDELGARIARLVETMSSINARLGGVSPELRKDRPKGLRQVKDDEIGVGSEIGARLAIRYSKEFWNYVRTGIEQVTRAPGHTLGDEVKAQPPISTSPGTMSGDRQEPRESVTILAEDRGLAKLHADQDLCIDVDPAAVFLTISRLRPQKGAVREEQREAETSSRSEVMPDGDKDGEDCQLLDIPEFLDRRSEANQASVSKKESKRSP